AYADWIELGHAMGLTQHDVQQGNQLVQQQERAAQYRDPRVDQLVAVHQQQQQALVQQQTNMVSNYINEAKPQMPHYEREVSVPGLNGKRTIRHIMGDLIAGGMFQMDVNGRLPMVDIYNHALKIAGLPTAVQEEQARKEYEAKQAKVVAARKAAV